MLLVALVTREAPSKEIEVNTRFRLGYVLGPLLYNYTVDRLLREVIEMLGGGPQNTEEVHKTQIQWCCVLCCTTHY